MIRSRSGIYVCIAFFLLGGLLVAGLFLAPRSPSTAPKESSWGVPAQKLRFVSFNIKHNERGRDKVLRELLTLNADFVLLQEIDLRDVDAMTEQLKMHRPGETPAFYPSHSETEATSAWGNAIFSKFPLYEMRSIPNPGGRSFGVWATAVVDGKKFLVASVHLSPTYKLDVNHIRESQAFRHKELTNLFRAWKEQGSPPLVVGGDFNQFPMGDNYTLMTQSLTDALGALGKTQHTFQDELLRTRLDYFLISPAWKALAGDVVESEASDHRVIWVELGAGT